MHAKQKNFDLAVVGAGIAGMVSAVRACELGLSVVVLEKSSDDKYMCNTRLTSGVFHCALQSPSQSAQALNEKIMADTDEFADMKQAQTISSNALASIRWLQSLGIRFIKGSQHYYEFILSPPTLFHQHQGWLNKGGDLLLDVLEKKLLEHEGQLLRGHQVMSLNYTPQDLLEIDIVSKQHERSKLNAKNVVIADGGFQSNPTYLQKGISKSPDKVFQRNSKASMGDGMRMVLDLGGAVSSYENFYGHLLSKDAFTNEHLWPNPWLDAIAGAGMLVNESGERFANEGLGGIYLANQVAKLDNPLGAFAIADECIWRERGNLNMQGPNPKLIDAGATFFKGDSLFELAHQAGIDADRLLQTVNDYNTQLKQRALHTLTPRRTQDKGPAYPIVKKPFYIFPVCAGITYTMGGIQINEHAQVLNPTHSPMKGLFAVGACTGGLEGGPKTGYVGGLIKSAVMGLQAAQFISKFSQ
jgi:fumarate reductase flavoprotein subunit